VRIRFDLIGCGEQPAQDFGRVTTEELEQEEHEQDDSRKSGDHLPESA